MECSLCGSTLPTSGRTCRNCGSIGVRFTVAPRDVLEVGIASSLIFGLLGVSAVVLGLTGFGGVYWRGSDLGTVFTVVGLAATCVGVAALFTSSLFAMRMLDRIRRAQPATAEPAVTVTPVHGADTPEENRALVQPASVTEHTTLRLVALPVTTEKVPVAR